MPVSSLEHLTPLLLDALVWAAASALRIGVAVFGGYFLLRFLRVGLGRLEALLIRAGEPTELVPGAAQKRVSTLMGLVQTLALVTTWAVVAVITLGQLGLDVTPILAGAGIAGLAVGFGAQNLVPRALTERGGTLREVSRSNMDHP